MTVEEQAKENLLKLLDECWSRDWRVVVTGPTKGRLSKRFHDRGLV